MKTIELRKKRRKEWFDENGPCVQCGSSKQLEVDHIDPKTKITHTLWSRKKEFRDMELAKCQVLCHECHQKKSNDYTRELFKGVPNVKLKKLRLKDWPKIKSMRESGMTYKKIGEHFNVHHSTVSYLFRHPEHIY